jgi:4'-phosphopantetheinyl transferase
MTQTIIYWTVKQAAENTPWWNGTIQPDFLSPTEQEKLATLRFEKRRREWLLGRWTAKHLLQAADPACAGLHLQAISIENDPSGAPHASLPGSRPLEGCLSISHRENAAVCAYCPDPSVLIGADLERVEPRSLGFINDYLTAAEAAAAHALEGNESDRWVMVCWSVKEAVLKALRIGLRADTRNIELFSMQPPGANGWGVLDVRASLPGANSLRAWWQPCNHDILTLAALVEPAHSVMIKNLDGE